MTIALFATGDELINGDTLNTTQQQIAQSIVSEGFSVGYHLSAKDHLQSIKAGLRFLTIEHKTIILTGGLGPTSDDLTRFALAQFLELELVEHAVALAHIQARLKWAHLPMNMSNRQQALFPAVAQLLANPKGTAMGCYVQHQDVAFFLLPGPPKECIPMFQDQVLPILRQRLRKQADIQLKWRLFGVSESQIAEKLERALEPLEGQYTTGYRLEMPYLEFKLRCLPALVNTIHAIIDPLVNSYIISPVEKRASTMLYEFLLQNSEPVVFLDEVTGGLLQTLLQKPQTLNTVSFDAKTISDRRFYLTGLDEYWQKQGSKGMTEISIRYQAGEKTQLETHKIPYFNQSVVFFAAELIAARVLEMLHNGRVK